METKILKLHKEGLSNRQIAKLLNLKGHYLIKPILDKHKLKANGGVRRNEPLLIKGVDALCQSCNEFKSIKSFRVNRKGKPDEYRLKSCNKCNWKKRNIYLNNNINAYLQDRIISIKTKRGELGFDIDLEYISNLYEKQKGKCIYTGVKMLTKKGSGLLDNTLSFDRINSEIGYLKGNVVLCTKKVNVCKSNLDEDTFKKWMPTLYKRFINNWHKYNL